MNQSWDWIDSLAGYLEDLDSERRLVGRFREQAVAMRAALQEARDMIAANRLVLGEYVGVRELGELEDRISSALNGRTR